MKNIIPLVALFFFSLAHAGSIKTNEIELIHGDIRSMYASMEAGDASRVISKTYERLYALAGGKANYEKIVKQSVSQIAAQGVKYVSLDLGLPEDVYETPKEEVCFVPLISIMEVRNQRLKTVGFMVAIRKKDTQDWRYLDGSGMRGNKESLWKIIPELQRDVKIPDNYIVRL